MSNQPNIDTEVSHLQRSGRDVSALPAALSGGWPPSWAIPAGDHRIRCRLQRDVL